jgi:hypothetical protein
MTLSSWKPAMLVVEVQVDGFEAAAAIELVRLATGGAVGERPAQQHVVPDADVEVVGELEAVEVEGRRERRGDRQRGQAQLRQRALRGALAADVRAEDIDGRGREVEARKLAERLAGGDAAGEVDGGGGGGLGQAGADGQCNADKRLQETCGHGFLPQLERRADDFRDLCFKL